MDKTFSERIVDDQFEINSFDKEETINVKHDLPYLFGNCVFSPPAIDYTPKETNAGEIYSPSDSLIQQQVNKPTSNKDERYRIHLGTQPGYYE
jgi:hypothetical protein